MTACATGQKIIENVCGGNLILPVQDTDFSAFLDEVGKLARFAHEIIAAVERDLDRQAQERKNLRLADRKFLESRTGDLPGMDSAELTIKDGFQFGELGCRGLDAVRDELLEKVLAYNCCRSILLMHRNKYKLNQAA